MNIVAIDTSLKINTVSVTVKNDNGIFTHECHFSKKLIAERLLNVVDQTLKDAQLRREQIELVIAPEGPGSFTGLRLAYAFAKALVLANNAKLVCVPTLECLAFSLSPSLGQLLVVVDAKRNSVYGKVFLDGKQASEVYDLPFSKMILSLESKPTICLCSGYNEILQYLEKENIDKKTLSYLNFIEYKNVFSLDILNYFLQNKTRLLSLADNDYASPVYVRKSDAKVQTK